MKPVYKIVPSALWQAALDKKIFSGAPVDLADGYIHFSNSGQVRDTAAKHFSGQDDLLLVAVDAESFGPEMKWEVSRGGALFPHLYKPLATSQVLWVKPLPMAADGHHIFPELDPA